MAHLYTLDYSVNVYTSDHFFIILSHVTLIIVVTKIQSKGFLVVSVRVISCQRIKRENITFTIP